MGFTVTVRTNRINQVQASIKDHATDAVRDSAEFMRDYAAQIAPARTGAFAASLYVNGPEGFSNYQEHASMASQRNPHARIISEIRAADVDTGLGQLRANTGQFSLPEAIVASAVEYSVFLEDGTRYMAPRPTLRPAAEATRTQFAQAMSHVAD